MNAVAVMLLGLEVMQDRKYWLQMVDDKEGSPDCWRRLNLDHLCRLNFDQGLLLT